MTILQGPADPQPVPTENTPPGETRRGRGKGRVQPETSRGGRKRLREPERRRRYGKHVVGEVRPKSERLDWFWEPSGAILHFCISETGKTFACLQKRIFRLS